MGTIIVAGMCGVVGVIAGRVSAPAVPIIVAAAPRVAPVVLIAPAPMVATPDPVTDDMETDDADGIDVAVVLATLNEQVAAHATGQAMLGRVTDWDGEAAVGCTLVATSPSLVGEQVVITDENGDYGITGLPPGYYTLTLYYNDNTFVRTDIPSREIENTHFDVALSLPPPREDYVQRAVEEPPMIEPEQGFTIENMAAVPSDFEGGDDYVRTFPVPGRTFEAVVGAAAGAQTDSMGVTFSGVTSIENTYVAELVTEDL